jgi:DNA segregation ATPase FtsK/SpoIIIE, S-DNA-T family
MEVGTIMQTNPPFDLPDDNNPHDDTDPGADVLNLDEVRARRRGSAPVDGDDTDDVADDDDFDHETTTDDQVSQGVPVDSADDIPRAAFGQVRKPILPGWASTIPQLRATVRHSLHYAGYVVAYHAVRSPKYAGKLAVYAPYGAVTSIGRAVRWATAEEGNWGLRQHAASRGDADTWLKLDRQRQQSAPWRWWALLAGAVGVIGGAVLLIAGPVPLVWRMLAGLGIVLGAARLGRPADKPITDRVSEGRTYRKLTAELVRRALASLGMAGINSALAKDPGAISFPTEIHRDGPGHLAIVDLPYGVEASEVIARRGKLASGLRLPLDQVWPEPAPGHTGRLALWVGHEPASQMRLPAWPLLKAGRVDVFTAFPMFTTPRLDLIGAEFMFRNWLFGGQPGSGKTFGLRLALLGCALDPRVEIRGYELKGVGDFAVLGPLLAEYGNGFDDDTLAACAAMIEWLYDECQRRSKKIAHYAAIGKAPENKVTPELASLKGSGLHPLVAWIDEYQELGKSKFGKAAGETLEKVIKLGRALGVIVLIGTQIPDKDSLPTGITRNVNTRFCCSVADQIANDMILGTSAYKNGYRATVFEPVVEAGWGILAGLGKPGARKTFYVNTADAAQVVARAIVARRAVGTLPDLGEQTRDTGTAYDLLADVMAVWPEGEDKAPNADLIDRLTTLRPEVYTGWKPEALTAALKPCGVDVGQIGRRDATGKTVNRRGPALVDIRTAVAERNRKKASD